MSQFIIEALNIGLPKKRDFRGKVITTGICKKPVHGPQKLGRTGFEGDGVGDRAHHGGVDKAVCVYSLDHYPYWEELLGVTLPEAAFGENLSLSNAHEDDVCLGDIYQAGTAFVQVSQPRQPCRTLAARHGRTDLVKLVADSGRTGFYLRVLSEGLVEKGDQLVLQKRDPHGISVSFANRILHHDREDCDGIAQVLAVEALSSSWKVSFQRLKKGCS